jgi:hypothetical protein
MPLLPASLGVDPVYAALLSLTAFVELSSDDVIDPDWAMEVMEQVAQSLRQLPAERVRALREQVGRVADHARSRAWGKMAVTYFAEFLENLGVEGGER